MLAISFFLLMNTHSTIEDSDFIAKEEESAIVVSEIVSTYTEDITVDEIENPEVVEIEVRESIDLPEQKSHLSGEDFPIYQIDKKEKEEKYTEEDIVLIAKMLYGECLGVPSYEEKAACAWVVLNRVDSGYGTIEEVITAPGQFYGYSASNPVSPELYDIANSTLKRWSLGYRDLPIDYLWFASRGDGRNYFRNSYSGGEYWEFN